MAVLDQVPELHPSCTVLLKPNLITARHGVLPCTEPAFIVAAARWFVDRGCRVKIGDSPALGTATAALKTLGIAGELTALGVHITDFTRARDVSLAGGGTARVAVDALECDLLVNLPRVKAHAQTRFTLAVKNCFGCLVGMRKPWWHMAYGGRHGSFCDRLVQLLDVMADSVTLVDGITAMHKTGPIHGEPYPLHLMAAGTNPVAVDCALHHLLRLDPEKSPLLQACLAAGHAGAEFSQLQFPLAAPSEFPAPAFQFPEALIPIRFDPFHFIRSALKRIMLSGSR